jgi:hypothetical protein
MLNYLIHWKYLENNIVSWICALLEGIVGLLIIKLGQFYYLSPSGPYQVGHRQLVLRGKTSPPVSVYYPISKEYYEKHSNSPSKTFSFCLEGHNDVKGFRIGMDTVRRVSTCSEFRKKLLFGLAKIIKLELRELMYYRLQVVNDAPLHEDFKNGAKKMTPVIVSHGLLGNRTFLASYAYFLVSYGCIVYC